MERECEIRFFRPDFLIESCSTRRAIPAHRTGAKSLAGSSNYFPSIERALRNGSLEIGISPENG